MRWCGLRGRFGSSLNFDDLSWLRSRTRLPPAVKGVLRGNDALQCVAAGASAVVVSNHGGRQLDTAVAPSDALADVVAAVEDNAEVYVDGGIRRGTDVLKALALGARAALMVRPVLRGLLLNGAEGVNPSAHPHAGGDQTGSDARGRAVGGRDHDRPRLARREA